MLPALLGAVAVGLSLGLLGAGGSILTVPVLLYLLHQPEKEAIAGSLFVVGTIALSAALSHALAKRIDWGKVALFGLPGMAGAWAGAWIGRYLPGPVQLLMFAAVMFTAAVFMFKPGKASAAAQQHPGLLVPEGFGVGMVTGLVGVGGGFLIVPALVFFGRLDMHRAVATSLVIITLQAFTGFVRYTWSAGHAAISLDWPVLAVFVAAGVVGSLAGGWLAPRIPRGKLRRIFAVFLVLMTAFIIIHTVSTNYMHHGV